jgi:hypothetical protein
VSIWFWYMYHMSMKLDFFESLPKIFLLLVACWLVFLRPESPRPWLFPSWHSGHFYFGSLVQCPDEIWHNLASILAVPFKEPLPAYSPCTQRITFDLNVTMPWMQWKQLTENHVFVKSSSSQVRWNTHKLSSSLKFHQLVVFCSLKS